MKAPNNQVSIIGHLMSEFQLNHETFGEKFYMCIVEVERLSGAKDNLPIIVSEKLIDTKHTYDKVFISGQIRSYNLKEDTHKHHMLYVFANEFDDTGDMDLNEVYTEGILCKAPIYRETPLGRQIADVMIAIPRAYGKNDYIPCVVWGRDAVYISHMSVGTKIKFLGRFQSREYVKKDETIKRTAYEVSISKVVA